MAALVGIDLGGRTTAKTALCVLRGNQLELISARAIAARCGTSDDALLELIASLEPTVVGIDAPLSLPDVHSPHYHLRPGDRELGAQSPFVLGLSRALYLHHRWRAHPAAAPWVEVYPRSVLRHLRLRQTRYKDDPAVIAQLLAAIHARYPWALPDAEWTGDDLDALLALVATWHYHTGAYRDLSDTDIPYVLPL